MLTNIMCLDLISIDVKHDWKLINYVYYVMKNGRREIMSSILIKRRKQNVAC